MKTEMTLEFYGTAEDAEGLLRALAKSGVVLHQARIQGAPVDVTPLLELVPEEAEEDEPAGPFPGIDLTERAGEVAMEHGLTAEDFAGRTQSGTTGFTVADVEAIVAEREPGGEGEGEGEPAGDQTEPPAE